MKITILAVGSRGDVQPYVALGLGLQGAGHRVLVAAAEAFEDLVVSRGLDYFPLQNNPRAMLESEQGQQWLETGGNPITFMRQLARVLGPVSEEQQKACWQPCEGSDAILYSPLASAGYHFAEKLGVPGFAASLQPLSPTRAFPTMTAPQELRLGGTFNLLTHLFTEQLFWQPSRRSVNAWRQTALQLPPLPWSGPYRRMRQQRWPILYGYSPTVLAKPADWPAWYHVTGYWFLERPTDWQPPARLLDFLAAGPPPVYIGFGSMTPRHAERLTEVALAALQATGCRGVLQAGWAGLGAGAVADDVYAVTEIPHDWLFPQMAAVVHHGGAGTTAAALRAGVPAIITPLFAD